MSGQVDWAEPGSVTIAPKLSTPTFFILVYITALVSTIHSSRADLLVAGGEQQDLRLIFIDVGGERLVFHKPKFLEQQT